MALIFAFFFGMFVPIKHILSSHKELPELFEKGKYKDSLEFYVRRPEKLSPRQPTNISPISKLDICINYKEGEGKRTEATQNCIIHVELWDIVEIENTNTTVDDNKQNFLQPV